MQGQSTTGSGTAGQYDMTITQGPTTLWEMTVVRPSASSGTRKSGIEVQNVKYKGKMVLKRGHVPVLNVKYNSKRMRPLPRLAIPGRHVATPATGNTDSVPFSNEVLAVCPAATIANARSRIRVSRSRRRKHAFLVLPVAVGAAFVGICINIQDGNVAALSNHLPLYFTFWDFDAGLFACPTRPMGEPPSFPRSVVRPLGDGHIVLPAVPLPVVGLPCICDTAGFRRRQRSLRRP